MGCFRHYASSSGDVDECLLNTLRYRSVLCEMRNCSGLVGWAKCASHSSQACLPSSDLVAWLQRLKAVTPNTSTYITAAPQHSLCALVYLANAVDVGMNWLVYMCVVHRKAFMAAREKVI